jgi:hypothetical protein
VRSCSPSRRETDVAADSRVRTRARLTKTGRRAYAAHVAALQRIVAGAAAIAPGLQAGEPIAAIGDD